jgi:hypothetical protein
MLRHYLEGLRKTMREVIALAEINTLNLLMRMRLSAGRLCSLSMISWLAYDISARTISRNLCGRFYVITAVLQEIQVFQDVTLRRLVKS